MFKKTKINETGAEDDSFFKKVVEYLMVEVGWVPESPSRPKSKAGINAKFQSILFVKMENVNRMILFGQNTDVLYSDLDPVAGSYP